MVSALLSGSAIGGVALPERLNKRGGGAVMQIDVLDSNTPGGTLAPVVGCTSGFEMTGECQLWVIG